MHSVCYFSCYQFSPSVVSNSLQLHGLQHARLPCPSSTPGAYSNSCLSSQWCHSAISSSIAPFPSCPQSFPASGSFPLSQLFTSGGQNIGDSVSASVLPMSIQGWFLLRLTGLISCCLKDSQESSPAPQFESISSFALFLLYGPALTSVHDYWKVHSLDKCGPLSAKWFLCFLTHCLHLSHLSCQEVIVF